MCMIVDANRLGIFLTRPESEDALPIHNWIEKGWGNLIYSTGGKFAGEVGRNARHRLAGYLQAGRATFIPASKFAKYEREFADNKAVRSDDPHVLALARFSGARLLYTADKNLRDDFKDTQLLKPKGKIYSGKRNAGLLRQSTCRK